MLENDETCQKIIAEIRMLRWMSNYMLKDK